MPGLDEATEILIREFCSSDVDAVEAIAIEAGLSYWSKEDYMKESLERYSVILVATDASGKVIGFLAGRIIDGVKSDVEAEILNIGVSPLARRTGIGSRLVSDFVEECAQRLVRSVWLEVRSKNRSANAFYRSLGFLPQNLRRNYYSDPVDDGVMMQLVLE